jgi:hypothetical protein
MRTLSFLSALAVVCPVACSTASTELSESGGVEADGTGGRPVSGRSDVQTAPDDDSESDVSQSDADSTSDISLLDGADGPDTTLPSDVTIEADGAEPDPVDTGPLPYGGPPDLIIVFPQVAVAGGIIYLEGLRLARSDGDASETRVYVEPVAGGAIELGIVDSSPVRLAVETPLNYVELLGESGSIFIETPDGLDRYQPVFATSDLTFVGKTNPGEGLLGNVYRLVDGTSSLPNLDAPCGVEPNVVSDASTPCPFTSIVASQLDIPNTPFESGFPGLSADLLEWFAIRFTGYLQISTVGEYRFQVCSDDGANLRISGSDGLTTVVANDGLHSMQCAEGSIVLEPGPTPFELDYFQGPRTFIGLEFRWQPPGTTELVFVPEGAVRIFP